MKYLKKYDEGFIDWIRDKFTQKAPIELEDNDTDDNKIAKGIIKTILPSVDPDNIQNAEADFHINSNTDSITLKLGGGSNLQVTRRYEVYVLKVDDDEISCGNDYKKSIFNNLLKQYKDEQARIKFQRISTNIGL